MLVYTAALLLGPLPVMPFERGTREFAWAVAVYGAALAAGSYYMARGEWRLRHRGLLGQKLLATSLITLAFGLALLAFSFVHLVYESAAGAGLGAAHQGSLCGASPSNATSAPPSAPASPATSGRASTPSSAACPTSHSFDSATCGATSSRPRATRRRRTSRRLGS